MNKDNDTMQTKWTVNRADIVALVADKVGLRQKEVDAIVRAIEAEILEGMQQGREVRLDGFGTFKIIERAPRLQRDHSTGGLVTVPRKVVAKFAASQRLRQAVAGGTEFSPSTSTVESPKRSDAANLPGSQVTRISVSEGGRASGYIQQPPNPEIGASDTAPKTNPPALTGTADDEYQEGQRLLRERSYFKRNPRLVAKAKAHHGTRCQVCDFDFAERYGSLGEGYIECHHRNPLSEREDADENLATTIADLAVLCSNCHRMIHRRRPALTLRQLRAALR